MAKPLFKSHLRRKLLLIGLISLLLAMALELYTFGLHADFPGRLLRSFLVLFLMIALTVLAIVPGVGKAVDKVMK